MNRRDIFKIAGATVAANLMRGGLAPAASAQEVAGRIRPQTKKPKKVIIAGGGIGGLCCAYELMMRGHDVTLLEASGRTGGHVKTIHDPLADGLYADVGAEHFTKPGYDLYWGYVREFDLTALYYP
ncbi:MAG: FAD-dependent oxidoreductase, partial [Terriglobia bacterium]